MNLVDRILESLNNSDAMDDFPKKRPRSYKGVEVGFMGIPIIFTDVLQSSLRSTLFRLNKNGLIRKNNSVWQLTPDGKKYLKTKIKKIHNTNR